MSLSLRHYLFPETGDPQRLSQRVAEGLIHGTDAILAYANTKQRVLTVILECEGGKPQEVRQTEGAIWRFDAEGNIREGLSESLREAMQNAFQRPAPEGKVVSIAPRLHKKRFAEEHRWEPTTADIERVIADIWLKKGTKRLAEAKGIAPRRPPLTYEAKRALDKMREDLWKVGFELDKLSDPALKGLAFEARQRATDDEELAPIYRAFAEIADNKLELLRRRRSNKGIWYALVELTQWDESRRSGQCIATFHERCTSRQSAVEASRKLLVEHAAMFDATISIEASVLTDLEWRE